MLLSVVIPAKNEELNLGRCLDSVISAVWNSIKPEIIVADCASTDKTVTIAKKYPVKILGLKPHWVHTPAAARYIGTLFSQGEFIFFIDSDMTLEPGFIEKAINLLKQDKSTAAVGGVGKEIYFTTGKERLNKPNLYSTRDIIDRVNFLGGAALYRKAQLLEAGGFNPYLCAGEENELSQRLRIKGYLLVSMPIPMITHYSDNISDWHEFMRKKKMNLFLGIGQSLRLSHSFNYFLETLLYYKEFTAFLVFIFSVLLAALFFFFHHSLIYFIYPTSLLFVLFTVVCFKKGSLFSSLLSLLKWLLIGLDIIAGLLQNPKSPLDYPVHPDIIKDA